MCSTLLLAVYGKTRGTIKFYSDCWVRLKRECFVWLWSLIDLQWGHIWRLWALISVLTARGGKTASYHAIYIVSLVAYCDWRTSNQGILHHGKIVCTECFQASSDSPCHTPWPCMSCSLNDAHTTWKDFWLQVLETLLLCHICTIEGVCKKSEHLFHCSQSYFQCTITLVHFSSISSPKILLFHSGSSYSVEESCDHIRFAILQCRPIAIIITRACHETLAISTEGIWFVSLSLGKIATVFLWFSRSWYLDGTKLHSS